jgi:hypothetical protein
MELSCPLALVCGLAASPLARADGPLSDRAPVVVRVTDGGFHWGDAASAANAAPPSSRRARRRTCPAFP